MNDQINNYRTVLRTKIKDGIRKYEELIKQAKAIDDHVSGLLVAENELDKYWPIGGDKK